ncbi:STY4528 family pathogenicity island replication protein [Pseudomonas aeruginosa]|uniref:STY4528 family pathogenicity island replication protein n=1 Tax=Pseudomonas aeruginosa TaxID=287 RepID=UPI003D664158
MQRQPGPVSLSALLDNAQQAIRHSSRPDPDSLPGDGAGDTFLFSGNRHESVPRALFLDRRLTPLERNAWQVCRLQLNDDGLSAFPTYEQLRPFLASMPCAANASFETISKALTILRLTRWISLVQRRRDPRTGRIMGNLYVLHDDPLTPWEAMQLDSEYLGLVCKALTHPSKAVQAVGEHVLCEMDADPLLKGRVLPTRLEMLMTRLSRQVRAEEANTASHSSCPQEEPCHESEESGDSLLRIPGRLVSESEAGLQAASDGVLRNPKQDRTVRFNNQKERTVPGAGVNDGAMAPGQLRLPDRFLALKQEQQSGALVALRQVEAGQRQAVLDEWAARCGSSPIRNPAGYLFGIIQKAIHGDFNATATSASSQMQRAVPSSGAPRPEAESRTPSELAIQHLEQLRGMLGGRK